MPANIGDNSGVAGAESNKMPTGFAGKNVPSVGKAGRPVYRIGLEEEAFVFSHRYEKLARACTCFRFWRPER